jgi:hypothetical protein
MSEPGFAAWYSVAAAYSAGKGATGVRLLNMALVVTLCHRLLQLWAEHVDAVSPARKRPPRDFPCPNHLTPLATLPFRSLPCRS